MSPYDGLNVSEWKEKTEELVKTHPLDTDLIVDVVLKAWEGIMKTKIADELQIGVDVFPSPQILGNYLHELIPTILAKKYPTLWRKEQDKSEKDLVYIPDPTFSVEIKTSSNANNVYGNRSYGQKNSDKNSGKAKDGYYITVNFEKFNPKKPSYKPQITKIRFGWIDHSDWHAQAAATGQQSYLDKIARDNKLLLLYYKK
jgi:hypothetical protein